MSLLFKLSGLFILFLVCTALGFQKSVNIKKRSHRLNSFYRSLILLAERIKSGAGEIGEILPLCFNDTLVYIEKGEILFDKSYLETADIDLIDEYFSNLGFSDKDSEYERTRLFISLIKKQLDQAEEMAQSLCKLYNTLGVLIGVFICIFLL